MKNDESLFVRFLGSSPMIRVLDFLIENNSFDYSKKDICRNSGVSWNTLETFWKELEENEIVVYIRQVGKASMYKLNSANPIVKQLIELDNKLMKKSLERIGAKKEKIPILARARK